MLPNISHGYDRLGWPEFLDSTLLCTVDSVYDATYLDSWKYMVRMFYISLAKE